METIFVILLIPVVALGMSAGMLISAAVSFQVDGIGFSLLIAAPGHLIFWLVVRIVRHYGTRSEMLGLSTTAWKALIIAAYVLGMACGIAIMWE